MTALVWDEVGTRFYEAGVDRGVLYLPEGLGIPWNGLISVNESVSGKDSTAIYFDGAKFAEVSSSGEFAATLTAYTFPDEFLQFEGILDGGNGLYVTNQPAKRFGLSYRTKVGNDENQDDYGYKIHILYNLNAVPSSINYQTFTQDQNAIEFQWNITAIPGIVPGFVPTAHIILDTRHMSPLLLESLEATLYGNEINEPRLPDISTLVSFIGSWVIIRIIDHFDGTWSAEGPDDLITMLDSTTFQIVQANAVYSDADTYDVGDTTY